MEKFFYLCRMKDAKTLLLTLFLLLNGASLWAQEDEEYADGDTIDWCDPDGVSLTPRFANVAVPWAGMTLGGWNLHQGLNGQVSAGVNVGWGKHNPWKGASFFSSLAGLYVFPSSRNGRWTGAVGGYYTNYKLMGQQVNSAGVIGLVDYQMNERMSATGFLMHDFGVLGGQRNHCPCALGGWGNPSTTLGAALNMKIAEHAVVSVGLSVTRQQNPFGWNEMMMPNSISSERGARDFVGK